MCNGSLPMHQAIMKGNDGPAENSYDLIRYNSQSIQVDQSERMHHVRIQSISTTFSVRINTSPTMDSTWALKSVTYFYISKYNSISFQLSDFGRGGCTVESGKPDERSMFVEMEKQFLLTFFMQTDES